MTVKTGLVTVLFNSASVLPGFFESMSKQNMQDYWLFIIDNSLDDRSYTEAEKLIAKYGFENVTLIHCSITILSLRIQICWEKCWPWLIRAKKG